MPQLPSALPFINFHFAPSLASGVWGCVECFSALIVSFRLGSQTECCTMPSNSYQDICYTATPLHCTDSIFSSSSYGRNCRAGRLPPCRTVQLAVCVAGAGTRPVPGSVVVWPGRRAVLPPLQYSMPARAAPVTWYCTLLYLRV